MNQFDTMSDTTQQTAQSAIKTTNLFVKHDEHAEENKWEDFVHEATDAFYGVLFIACKETHVSTPWAVICTSMTYLFFMTIAVCRYKLPLCVQVCSLI